MNYDVIIVGAGPGGIFTAYELAKAEKGLKVAVFELGQPLDRRKCPIDGKKIKACVKCPTCSIMSGFGGAGAFSDGKYNITNQFGGTLYEYVGKQQAIELMRYVDKINLSHGGAGTKLYSTANTKIKRMCLENGLHLLDAQVRHLGTDINYVVLGNIYEELKDRVDFHFNTAVSEVKKIEGGYEVQTAGGVYTCEQCVVSVGRSGSKWMERVCGSMDIPTKSNRVDIGVRVELPAEIFSHLTDELYESKIVYRTEKFEDLVRTFCMNPHGVVVNENTNGIVTVNGHSYEDKEKHTENTNFALLVSKHFSEPFKDSNGYGESIARLSNMLGGGVMVQRFGDLVRGRRSTVSRIEENFVTPTLAATPGDLSLVIPKRILDGIIEMIYALDKIAPGTANDDTLLYGVEVKFYNMEVEIDGNLETKSPGMYVIGDCSGVTHSLSHASASGVHVARHILQGLGA
ncbi:MAG: FAD-dependent oxidoreductase [Clostridia bacterium]|nr:NAD(P)/FAD-dependent oxidoreductase [Oscillospiraceae bacterium]MBS5433484.1 NAD(P)/FAD-dependent oxidoreductase [Bacillota bacterium]PWM15767.1 MAG: FAD-dependent oxidoreductase [Clostridia bacterium]